MIKEVNSFLSATENITLRVSVIFLYILEANIGWDANFLENVKMVIADYVGLQMTNKM